MFLGRWNSVAEIECSALAYENFWLIAKGVLPFNAGCITIGIIGTGNFPVPGAVRERKSKPVFGLAAKQFSFLPFLAFSYNLPV